MIGIINKAIGGIFGSKKERDMKDLNPYVAKINAEFDKLQSLSNDELPNIIGKRGKECTAVWMWIRDTRRKFVHVAEVPSLLVETDLDWHVRFERVL